MLLVALLAAGALAAPGVTAAYADPAAPSLAQLNSQLNTDQATLNDLNDQVERAQATLDQLNRKLDEDHQREADLNKQLVALGRLEYEQPAFSLSTVLEARSLEQLMTDIAQAQLVAGRQRNVLNQARLLRRQDELARDQISVQLAAVQSARDQAAQVAARSLALRNSAQDAALRARAAALTNQAQMTGSMAPAGPWPNHFSFGYCTWYVATKRYVPWFGNAIEWWPNARAYGLPEGQAPRVGAIMVTRESGFGHVAYVEAVNSDGSWTVSEMNFIGWDVVDRRTLRYGQAPVVGFIYG
jgi:surface antigen